MEGKAEGMHGEAMRRGISHGVTLRFFPVAWNKFRCSDSALAKVKIINGSE